MCLIIFCCDFVVAFLQAGLAQIKNFEFDFVFILDMDSVELLMWFIFGYFDFVVYVLGCGLLYVNIQLTGDGWVYELEIVFIE